MDRHVWDERIRTFPILMRQRLEQKQRGGHVKFIPQLSYKNQMINYDKDPHLSLFVRRHFFSVLALSLRLTSLQMKCIIHICIQRVLYLSLKEARFLAL